jgi:DNA-directed RNA polymerase specialized sigma24 family protein
MPDSPEQNPLAWDAAWLQNWQAADPATRDQLFVRFWEQYHPFVRAILLDMIDRFGAHTLEDVESGCKLSLRKALESTRDILKLRGFTRRIVICRVTDLLRVQLGKRAREVSLEAELPSGEGRLEDRLADPSQLHPADVVAQAEDHAAVTQLLKGLGGECGPLIQRIFILGQSNLDIAQSDATNPMTVGTRLHRCLGKLRDLARQHPLLRARFRSKATS